MALLKLNGGWPRLALEIVALAFTAGVGWMALKAQVETKADKNTVEAMAEDIRVIKSLICRDHPGDSACLPRPRRDP